MLSSGTLTSKYEGVTALPRERESLTMNMVQEGTRKGQWTEQEDLQLVCFVGLLGERRWDFLAKVSGLNRTGKSCRLRWVNYLQPGLKRGRITPQEEQLVLELHSRWGNRWSKIARKLPGRTDNEIKNYWRTHMRKKAQERSRAPSTSSSSFHCCSPFSDKTLEVSMPKGPIEKGSMHDKGDTSDLILRGELSGEEGLKGYSMDQIWKEIGSLEEMTSEPVYEGCKEESCEFPCPPMASPLWDYSSDSVWRMNEDETEKLFPMDDLFCFQLRDMEG